MSLKQRRRLPRTEVGVPIVVRCAGDIVEAIDDWRAMEPRVPTRPAAVRRLLEQALYSNGNRSIAARPLLRRKRIYNWPLIEAEYRAGVFSVREIARRYEISDTAIRKKALKLKWPRLPGAGIYAPGPKREPIKERYSALEIFERDGWCCKLCGGRVARHLKYPHSGSASIDHIVPRSKGGRDIRSNVHLAHLKCNIQKSNRAGGQLLLFG